MGIAAADAKTLRATIAVLSCMLCDADQSATVEIPVAEHQRLHEFERQAQRRAIFPRRSCPRSRIDRDEEVALFIAERAGRFLLHEIAEECERVFGPERTPGLLAMNRFIQRLTEV